jgi:hypothetical protein
MFDIVYLILAHDNPSQLKKLVLALDGLRVFFYIHVDGKVDQMPFEKQFKGYDNVNFISNSNRLIISWGDNSTVKCTLILLQLVVKNNHTGYCILLSNSDYPIKSNYEIRQYFDVKYGNSFISMTDFQKSSLTYIQRLTYYKFDLSKNKKDFVLIPSIWDKSFYSFKSLLSLLRVLKRNQSVKLFKLLFKRKSSIKVTPFWGSQWWALPVEVVNEILLFCKSNQNFIDFHDDTLLSDEIFFQTILHHLHKEGKIKTIFDVRCTYMKFEDNKSSPEILLSSDFEDILKLPKRFLFARKFNQKIDSNVLDMLDSHLKKN